VYRHELAEKIREAGYAAVIEITNGLNSERFAGKCSEARWGKAYLKRCINAMQEESKVHIDSGVIFFKNEAAIGKSKHSLDFLYQLKELKRDRSLKALESVITNEDSPPLLITHAEKIFQIVNNHGMPLEHIFYPKRDEMDIICQLWHRMPTHPEAYQDSIRHIKGRVLEEYVAILCNNVMRSSPPIIVKRHEYEHRGHLVDMDLILIGDQDMIRKTLGNSHDLKRFETKRKEKEPTVRYSVGLAMPRRS